MKLKATKTSMYNLIKSRYPDIPIMKNTSFTKTYRYRNYKLTYANGDWYQIFKLEAEFGKVFLINEYYRYLEDYDEEGREKIEFKWGPTFIINFDELIQLKMIEE